MNVFKFRVVLDTQDDVFRDIEVESKQTLEEFYECILTAFEFRGGQMASFYLSNDKWDKGTEFTLLDMSEKNDNENTMAKTVLNDIIEEENQKLILVYDFLRMWCFFVELQEEHPSVKGTTYPRVVMKFGDAPDEETKEIDDAALFGGSAEIPDFELDEEDDEEGDENIEDEIGGMFGELNEEDK